MSKINHLKPENNYYSVSYQQSDDYSQTDYSNKKCNKHPPKKTKKSNQISDPKLKLDSSFGQQQSKNKKYLEQFVQAGDHTEVKKFKSSMVDGDVTSIGMQESMFEMDSLTEIFETLESANSDKKNMNEGQNLEKKHKAEHKKLRIHKMDDDIHFQNNQICKQVNKNEVKNDGSFIELAVTYGDKNENKIDQNNQSIKRINMRSMPKHKKSNKDINTGIQHNFKKGDPLVQKFKTFCHDLESKNQINPSHSG